ncbi:hypothetical protein TSAR_011288 [Trichomalopsis sarcophagae]|uniref:Ionotropic glutamate receptor C-terminal domain-containing protein n=1 Tax=Trichomalopsis sarcophagae TaxID=543379 RepID=A0A232FEK0_9HYME|nr:hypothetical protein TSAR_011288 [Trichomalopsis sarcophagae]
MYTVNPYNDRMTNRWSEVNKFVQHNDHPITVYKYEFPSKSFSSFICDDLLMDKTLNLSGYPITIAKINTIFDQKHELLVTVASRIISEIWHFLKANISIKLASGSFEVDELGNPQGKALLDLLYGKYDMKYTFDFERRYFWHYELNTYIPGGICYVAKKSESFVSYENLTSVLSHSLFVQVFLAAIIVSVLVSRWLRLNFGQVMLNTVRAIIGVAILHSPKSIIPRIAFMHVVIYSMVLNSYLQSHLSLSMVGEPKSLKIEKPTDLIKYDYKIFAKNVTHQYFSYWPFIYDQIQETKSLYECVKAIKVDERICCADDCHKIRSRIDSNGRRYYQVSEDIYLQWYYVFTFERDHPLLPRLRQVYARLYQSGVIVHLTSPLDPKTINPKTENSLTSLSTISFSEIEKGFYFIAIGQIAGMLVFISEVLVNLVLIRKSLKILVRGIKRIL